MNNACKTVGGNVLVITLMMSGCHQDRAKIGSVIQTSSGVQLGQYRPFAGFEGQTRMDFHSLNMKVGSIVRANLMDQESLFTLEFGPSTGWRTQEFDSNLSAQDVHSLGEHADRLRVAADKLVTARLELLILESRKLQLQKDSERDRPLLPREDLESQIDIIDKNIRKVENEIDGAGLDGIANGRGLRHDFETAERDAINLLKNRNVIIANWSENSEVSNSGSVNPFGSASHKRRKGEDGFVVIAGFRHSRLVIGNDFQEYLDSVAGFKHHSGAFSHSGGIVTATVEAKTLSYFSSVNVEERFDYLLDVSAQELQLAFGGPVDPALLAQLKVAVSGYAARVSALQSQGLVQCTKPSTFVQSATAANSATAGLGSAVMAESSSAPAWTQIAACITHSKYFVDRKYFQWNGNGREVSAVED